MSWFLERALVGFTLVLMALRDCVLYSEFGVDLGTFENTFANFYYCCNKVDLGILGSVCVECCSFPLWPVLIGLGAVFIVIALFLGCAVLMTFATKRTSYQSVM